MAARSGRVRPRIGGSSKEAPPLESFSCLYLCGSCGLLADPEVGASTRSKPESPPALLLTDCSHCKARAWIDLRNKSSALAVRGIEESLRQEPPPSVRAKIHAATGGIGAVTSGATALTVATLFAPPLGPLAVVAAATGGLAILVSNSLLAKPLSRLLMARSPDGPARWMRPLPLVDQSSEVIQSVRGRVSSSEEPLIAPFTRRPCVAYEVGVIFDADGDAYPPMWVLREVRSRALAVAQYEIDANRLELEVPLEDVTACASGPAADELRMFLRQRGLFVSDGRFDLFEAVVTEGAPVELHQYAEPSGGAWVVLPDPGS